MRLEQSVEQTPFICPAYLPRPPDASHVHGSGTAVMREHSADANV